MHVKGTSMKKFSVTIKAEKLMSILQRLEKENGDLDFDIVIKAESEDYEEYWHPTDTLKMKTNGLAGREKTIFKKRAWWNNDLHKTEWVLTMDGKTKRNYKI